MADGRLDGTVACPVPSAARREQILNAALEEITERGYEQATMARIARRAGASKETLYAWFGDKTGLASALIETSAFQTVGIPNPDTVDGQYTHDAARQALSTYSHELLVLITGRHSIALNRAAMSSPALAKSVPSARKFAQLAHREELPESPPRGWGGECAQQF